MKKTALLAAAALCMLTTSPAVNAADVYLTDTSVDLNVGDSWDISLVTDGGTVRYIISDTNVFTYDGRTLKAVGNGTAYLYAEYEGDTYTCTVTVKEASGSKKMTRSKKRSSDKSVTVNEGDTIKIPITCGDRAVYVTFSNGALGSVSCDTVTDGTFNVYFTAKGGGTGYLSVIDQNTNKELSTITIKVKSSYDAETEETAGTMTAKERADEADEVIRLVNEERAARGLSPLKKSDKLTSAAQTRAREIGVKFSHKRPDGTDSSTVITGKHYHIGENIAKNRTSASAVMKAWMSSEGHTANILSESYKYIGVAYNEKAHTWVQLFTD